MAQSLPFINSRHHFSTVKVMPDTLDLLTCVWLPQDPHSRW